MSKSPEEKRQIAEQFRRKHSGTSPHKQGMKDAVDRDRENSDLTHGSIRGRRSAIKANKYRKH